MADLFGHCNIIGCPSENLLHLFIAGVILGRDDILVLIFPIPNGIKALFTFPWFLFHTRLCERKNMGLYGQFDI